jgi:hypothetical protein
MTLGAPLALLCLAAVPLLWWLSLPSRPRVRTWSPHVQQWRDALAALRRRPPRLARLRFLLLALAAGALTLAFAQPALPGRSGPQRLVVVLDGSASMAAVDASGATAWERACARLRAAFASLPPHVDVTVLRAGGPLLRRHGASARALHDLGAPAGELAVDLAAVAVAAAARADTAVWTLTDGQGQRALPEAGALTVLPAAGANAAVLAVRVDDRWPLPELQLEVDVGAFGGSLPRNAAVAVAVRGAIDGAEVVQQVPAVARHMLTLALRRAAAGGELRVEVRLDGDVLPADDAWVALLPPLPAPRIAVLADGDGGVFADAAARTLAAEVGGTVVPASDGGEVGLVLVDGGRVGLAAGRTRALTFGTALAGAGEPSPWPQPAPLDWQRTDALTAGVDLSELRVQQAWRGVLPPGEPFLWADDDGRREPLGVVAGSATGAGDVASVHFAFRLQDSNLPLLAAFPQLLRRAFVRAYGPGAAPRVLTPPPAAGEQDLAAPARGDARELPEFGTPPQDLSSWCLALALAALALRAFVK